MKYYHARIANNVSDEYLIAATNLTDAQEIAHQLRDAIIDDGGDVIKLREEINDNVDVSEVDPAVWIEHETKRNNANGN